MEELHEAFCTPVSAQAGPQAAASSLGAEALSSDESQGAGQAQEEEGGSVPAKPQQQQQQQSCPPGLDLAAAEGAAASAGTRSEPGDTRTSSTADIAALDAPPGFGPLSLTASGQANAAGPACAVQAKPGQSARAAALHIEEPVVATASTTAAAGHGSESEEDPLAALMELDAELERKHRRQQRRAMQVGRVPTYMCVSGSDSRQSRWAG